jgi:hypothetical protein
MKEKTQAADPASSRGVARSGADSETREMNGSTADPPYVPPHEAAAQIQDGRADHRPIPLLPANAGGADTASVEDQSEPADRASMYERRPAPEYDRFKRHE